MGERSVKVSVFLSAEEAAELDRRRGGVRRPAYLRAAALAHLPPVIPELNREAWIHLARAAGNLNQIAHRLNAGEEADIQEIRAALTDFRGALISASREAGR